VHGSPDEFLHDFPVTFLSPSVIVCSIWEGNKTALSAGFSSVESFIASEGQQHQTDETLVDNQGNKETVKRTTEEKSNAKRASAKGPGLAQLLGLGLSKRR